MRQTKKFLSIVGALGIITLSLVGLWTILGDLSRLLPPISPTSQLAILPIEIASTTKIVPAEPPAAAVKDTYIEVTGGCDATYTGACVVARSGPATSYRIVKRLRTGIILKTKGAVTIDGHTWYEIVFDEELRYPERVADTWYVEENGSVRAFVSAGTEILTGTPPTTNKRIVVDLSSQTLSAYEGDTLFMKERVSTGIRATPTPIGNFSIFKKTPSRYMQGPIPGISDHKYDLPGVPWDMYFTAQGAAIHGAYWHDDFGHVHSNGCVNLPLASAEKLYEWADLGTPVTVEE